MKKTKYYSTRDLATHHNVDIETIRRWARKGKIASGFKLGRDWLFKSLKAGPFQIHPKTKGVVLDTKKQ